MPRLLPIPVLVLTAAAVALNYLSEPLFQRHVFNADALYLPVLFADVLEKSGDIRDWYLTPAPYYFPDFPIYWLAHLLGAGAYERILIFALLQIALTFGLVFLLFRQIAKPSAALAAACGLAILTALGLSGRLPFAYLFVSAHHYGIFLATLAILALWLKDGPTKHWLDRPMANRWAMLLISFLAAFSDTLFLLQASLPLLLMGWAFEPTRAAIRRPWSLPAFPIFAASLAGPILLSFLRAVFFPGRHGTLFGVDPMNAIEFFRLLLESARALPAFAMMFLGFLALTALAVRHIRTQQDSDQEILNFQWLAIFSGMALLTTLVGGAVLTDKTMAYRYQIAVHSWPILLCCLALALYGAKFWRLALSATALVAVVAAWVGTVSRIQTHGIKARYYPNYIRCIDDTLVAHGAQAGLSNYWDAKQVMTFSRLDLTLARHLDNLTPGYEITSLNVYKTAYDFAVIDETRHGVRKISAARLNELNGPPSQIVQCENRTLHIYPSGSLRTSDAN